MGEDQIDGMLCEIVKRCAFGYDVAEQSVVLLDIRLLVRAVWVTEKKTGFSFPIKGGFNSRHVCELSAVVGKDEREYTAEATLFFRKSDFELPYLVTSRAVLLSSNRPDIKLQNVKSNVRITLPPMRPMTVSISTHEEMSCTEVYVRKSS